MKETRADTRNALLQAFGLHVLLFALMLAGLHWTRSQVVEPAQGEPIQADLIDPSALSASMQRALQRDPEALPKPIREPAPVPLPPVPDPLPDPVPDPVPKPVAAQLPPPPVIEPAKVDQEKVQRDATLPDPAKVAREQDAKRRQQQVDLDALREKKLADIRKQREQASRELSMAEQRAQQLADAKARQAVDISRPAPQPGNRGKDATLLAQYVAALQQAIARQWTRPESVQIGQRCRLSIRQLPGGEVVDVTISNPCPLDELGRQSVERAVLKASPLPYAGFENVFDRNLNVNFVAEDR